MPDELTPEEHEILSESPADSPVRLDGDADEQLSPQQQRDPAEGGEAPADQA